MQRYTCARSAAAICEQESECEREQATCKREAKNKPCCLAQSRAVCAGHFKQWKQDEQADGKMDGERMKAAEKLLPVRVRVAVEADDPGHQQQGDGQRKCSGPG
jgi:hypothetical protein